MSVTITTINSNDSLGSSRVTINGNFTNLKNYITSLETYLTTSGNANVVNLTVSKGARSLATEIATIQASERVKGNHIVEGYSSTANLVASKATVNGNLTIKGNSSILTSEGDLILKRKIIMNNMADTALVASNIGTYTSVASNVGLLNLNNKHALILDFSNYSASANVENTNTVQDFKLPAGSSSGQTLKLIVKANSSSGKPHNLLSNNIASLSSTQKIAFQEDYGVVNFVYIGNVWIIESIYKANVTT